MVYGVKSVSSCKGFSLVEVCIALVVIGLLTTPLLYAYSQYQIARQVTLTKSAVTVVSSALLKYVAKYGHYPIPSDPNVPAGDPNFGLPAADLTPAWPACTAVSTTVCRTDVNAHNPTLTSALCPNVATDRGALIGAVPFAALGIPYAATLDGFGGRLTYAVTKTLTSAAQFNEVCGAIEVVDMSGSSIYSPATAQRSHYVLLSHGPDRAGAFTVGGSKPVACAAVADGDNCNNDARFRNNFDTVEQKIQKYFGPGAAHFDDFLITTASASSGIWTPIPNSPSMMASNQGNVYVGGCSSIPCIPKSHVDVKGNVRADAVRSKRLCYRDPGGCVEPESIGVNYIAGWSPPSYLSPDWVVGAPAASSLPDGLNVNSLYTWNTGTRSHNGAGIRCVGGRGLNGTSSFSEVCNGDGAATTYFKPSVNIGSCPSGQYPSGVDTAGMLVCQLP